MGRLNYAGIGFAALIAATVWVPSVRSAGIPVADAPSAANTTKDFLQRIKESKFVMDTVKMANKTSAAIGDAKKSVSEYVVKNKEKIEKKLEKVKEYKEQAEEYKKQYEDYKAQLDEGVAKAKEMKEQAEAGIEQAKETVDAAQQTAGAVKDMAQSKIDGAADKAGIDIGGSSNSGETSGSAGSAAVSPVSNSGSGSYSGAGSYSGSSSPAAGSGAASGTSAPAVSTPSSSRTAFGGAPAPAADLAPMTVENQVPLTDGAAAAGQEAAVIEENANTQINNVVSGLQQDPSPEAAETAQQDLRQIKSDSLEELDAIKSESDEQLQSAEEELDAARKEQRQMKKQLKSSTRRSFTTSSLPSGNTRVYASAATAAGVSPLAFAFDLSEMGIKLPDGGTDVNGTFIIPSTISMTCGGLSSDEAQKKDVMDNCLVTEINDKTRGAQAYEAQDMTATYIQGKKEFAAAYIAEAYIAANDTTYFVEKIIDPVEDAIATTTMDNYSNMVELNKAVATAINGLLKIHSADLALQAYDNYGAYKFMSPEES